MHVYVYICNYRYCNVLCVHGCVTRIHTCTMSWLCQLALSPLSTSSSNIAYSPCMHCTIVGEYNSRYDTCMYMYDR